MIDKITSSTYRPPMRKTTSSEMTSGPTETFERGRVDDPGVPAWGQSMTGDIRFHQVDSKILGNSRPVWVYLPPGYHDEPKQDYPVLFMCDGQNLFERGTTFGGVEWGVDEAAERLMREGKMAKTIIVAVANAGADRLKEYGPVKDSQGRGGDADKYGEFLTKELKPMIDSRYRTNPDLKVTGLAGSSMGGLVSSYLAFKVGFGLCGPMSPSLWFAGRDLLKEISALPPGQGPSRVWLDMGTNEDDDDSYNHNGIPDVLDDSRDLRDLLKERGYAVHDVGFTGGVVPDAKSTGRDLYYWEVPGATHDEASWSRRIDKVLMGLYPPTS